MARVNVDQKALTDPRFSILGSHLAPLTKAPREAVEAAYGLWVMVKVWNYCLERGLLVVPSRDLNALHDGLAAAMVDAQLGEFVPRSRARAVRIKGGVGRLDWLQSARDNGAKFGARGAEHGVKGGRPKKKQEPPTGVSENGVGGIPKNPLPSLTLSPSPALTPEEEKQKILDARFEENARKQREQREGRS